MRSFPLPLQLMAIFVLVGAFGAIVPASLAAGAYTFSLVFKEILEFLLPLIVFSFIGCGILSFKKKAPVVLTVLLVAIIFSNVTVAFASYVVGRGLLAFLSGGIDGNVLSCSHKVVPYFALGLPRLVRSEVAMLAAIVSGLTLSFVSVPPAERFVLAAKSFVERLLSYCVIPLLPFYVLGFTLKIYHEGMLQTLFISYGKTLGVMVVMQMMYLLLMYYVVAGFSCTAMVRSIKNALPSYLTALSTMSSTTTVPVTVECAERNIQNRPLALLASPILANVHLVGDGVTTPFLSLVTVFLFTGRVVDISTYVLFVFYLCITMLATSGIPGGGIIVMIPILKNILGFSSEMVSIITALYLLQDGFGTAGNVMGDGALMIAVNKVLKRFRLL